VALNLGVVERVGFGIWCSFALAAARDGNPGAELLEGVVLGEGTLAMVVRVAVRLEVKARMGAEVACGGHKIGGGSLGMVRLRAGVGTAMRANLRRTKVRRQEHSFDEHQYPL
jgi:hypothetical protein